MTVTTTNSRHTEVLEIKEGSRVTSTIRAVSLVDLMHRNRHLPADLYMAAEHYREMYLRGLGKSVGVGDYGASEGRSHSWGRMLTTDRQMRDKSAFKRATEAMFCVPDIQGRPVYDEDLAKQVLPAILSDSKAITAGAVAMERTGYRDKNQLAPVGTTVITEALHRLALHLGMRK